eukprot:TRINITY_DN9588_c2_g1_i1.p2 TRINITY_DN9588_c2_g1~~TRINITY_DN9588_c2_g1_i1.p2  ORF type:complete len:215 (+),score=47.24 TRINITY_DN9588_c2_g1_i1:83-727(+)
MSFTKEYTSQNPGGFKGAWWYKPWYTRKSHNHTPEPMRPEGLLHGAKGLEWPEYPGGYKPKWEDRTGVPGLYKPAGNPHGSYPAIRFAMTSARQRWRGSSIQVYAIAAAMQLYGLYWLKYFHRFRTQLADEERFRRFVSIPYLQAVIDCRGFSIEARFDRFCRKYIDHLPGIDRNFYHQENIWFTPWVELGTLYRHENFGSFAPHAPWFQQVMP